VGDVAALDDLATDLAADPALAELGERVAQLKAEFDFDGLRRLADWLESQEGAAGADD
jgi:hypothetical protein